MENSSKAYIGSHITIKAIRDFILDSDVTDADTILLSSSDYTDLIFEHRSLYRQSLEEPYLLLGVLVREETKHRVPKGWVMVVKNDEESIREKYESAFSPNEVVYRCGFCGNIVNEDGSLPSPEERHRKINYLSHQGHDANIMQTYGDCCPNGVRYNT